MSTPRTNGISAVNSGMTPVHSLKRTSAEARRDSGMSLMTPSKTPLSPDKPTMRLKLEIPQQETPKEDVRKRKSESNAADENKLETLQQETPKEDVRKRKRPMPRKAEMKAAENHALEIPQLEISKEQERKLKIQKAAAKRWAPNLQRPPPQLKEINTAYNNKLMRHYTDETAAPSNTFIRPPINRSARVDSLLASLPLQPAKASEKSYSQKQAEHSEEARRAILLQQNKRITESDYVKKLAWEAFSSNDQERKNHERYSMMISGLKVKEMQKEQNGKDNKLPDWRKAKTGRFAKSTG